VFWNTIFTAELKKLLAYKEELLTDVKNMLYRHTDDVEKLRVAARQLVEVVDPLEDGAADGRSLLEWLRGAPQKVLSFITEASTTYVSHALGLVKSFWPKARLEVLAQGVAADCSKEQFSEYLL
jgi:hypothetical protein